MNTNDLELERQARSLEAKLLLQDQLIKHLFVLLYNDDPNELARFIASQEAGLLRPSGKEYGDMTEASIERRTHIKMHLDLFEKAVFSEIRDIRSAHISQDAQTP